MPETETLTLEQIHALAQRCLLDNGCDEVSAAAALLIALAVFYLV